MNYDIKEIDQIVEEQKNNFIHKVNSCYLTPNEVEILKKYNIDYENCQDNKELLYKIEQYLQVNDSHELEWLSMNLDERNYYFNTNK